VLSNTKPEAATAISTSIHSSTWSFTRKAQRQEHSPASPSSHQSSGLRSGSTPLAIREISTYGPLRHAFHPSHLLIFKTSTPRFITLPSHLSSILHTNHEARHVGLGFYSLGFGQTFEDEDGHEVEDLRRSGIWVNWERDRVCLLELWRWDGEALGGVFQERGIKHLVLNAEIGDLRCAWFLGMRLETLTLYHAPRSLGMRMANSGFEFIELEENGGQELGAERDEQTEELQVLEGAKVRVFSEFEELEELQGMRDEMLARGEEVDTRALALCSPLFGDAFARSAGWLDGEKEILERRSRPDVRFARAYLGQGAP
jgi:hypothetical protein